MKNDLFLNTPKEDDNDSIDETNDGNVTTAAEDITPINPSEAESFNEPYRPTLKRIIFNLKNRRKVQVLAGIVVLILIIIGAIIFYKVSNHFWLAKQRRIVEKKCREYTKFACDLSLSSNSSQILLGEIAPLGMYPHMAYLEFAEEDDLSNYRVCGGSLISENFILSAAHCIKNLRKVASIASLGIVNITGRKPYGVKKVYVNPLYDHTADPYDFLLLELNQKVKFTPYVRPICLNTEYLGIYDRIIATGWGLTEDGKLSKVLRSADVVIDGVIAEKCAAALGGLVEQYICAGWPNSSKSGDSGGPLQVISDSKCVNTYVQIGVISAVQNRTFIANETLISLYVIVAKVLPWIASIVWPNESA